MLVPSATYPQLLNMSTPCEKVFHTDTLVAEILSFLDVASLGRVEQTATTIRVMSHLAWKVQADKVGGHHCVDGSSMSRNWKEQVRRYCRTRNHTRSCMQQHRRHYIRESTSSYITPSREPQIAPNCSFCNSYPNLKTSVLLSRSVDSYAFFAQISFLDRRPDEQSPSPTTVLEGFLPVQEVAPSATASAKYVTLKLNLSKSLEPEKWPALAHFLEGCRLQAPRDMQHIWFPKFSKELLTKLEVTVTAVDIHTGKAALLLATGGGTASSTDLLNWRLLRRMADSHPTPTALSFGVVPTIDSSIAFVPDYSTMDALEISISIH